MIPLIITLLKNLLSRNCHTYRTIPPFLSALAYQLLHDKVATDIFVSTNMITFSSATRYRVKEFALYRAGQTIKREFTMKMRRIVWIILIGSVLLLVSVLGFTGCNNDDDDDGIITITSVTADPSKIVVNGTSQLTCMATHSKSYPLEYIWVPTAGFISGSGHIVTWNAPGSRGEYIVVCKVIDNTGKQATADVKIEVVPLFINIPEISPAPTPVIPVIQPQP
jgi:hypothetical protein